MIERVLLDLAGQAAQGIGIGEVARERLLALVVLGLAAEADGVPAPLACPAANASMGSLAHARTSSAGLERVAQHLRQVQRAQRPAGLLGQPGDVHEAARVAGDQHVGRRRQHVIDLERPDRARDLAGTRPRTSRRSRSTARPRRSRRPRRPRSTAAASARPRRRPSRASGTSGETRSAAAASPASA